MSIRVPQGKKLENVVIVSEQDDSLDLDSFDWDDYTEDYDFAKLKFVAEKTPTRFICNFKFNASEAAEVKDSIMSSIEKNKAKLSMGTWQQHIVRLGLKEISYDDADPTPKSERLTLKKNGKYVRDDSLAILEETGLVGEIFSAYNVLTAKDKTVGHEKNL